jgi:riboflavin kinase/FMN adenylyltransferase
MTPEIFISDVLDSVGLASLTVGDDFRFGANRAGDFDLLKKWGSKKGIEVMNTETFNYEDQRVSSTRIRKALLNDDFQLAEILLGRPYTFSGKVVMDSILEEQLVCQQQIFGFQSKNFLFWSVCS